MTMGPMKAYHQAVHNFSGMKTLTNEAIEHWLDEVFPTLSSRTQQMVVDEVFFLATGLPPMDADHISLGSQCRCAGYVQPSGCGVHQTYHHLFIT